MNPIFGNNIALWEIYQQFFVGQSFLHQKFNKMGNKSPKITKIIIFGKLL